MFVSFRVPACIFFGVLSSGSLGVDFPTTPGISFQTEDLRGLSCHKSGATRIEAGARSLEEESETVETVVKHMFFLFGGGHLDVPLEVRING